MLQKHLIGSCLGADHEALDIIFVDARDLAASGDWSLAQKRFSEFACGLDRHITAEEEVLFPALEQRADMISPTRQLREEHSEIRRLVNQLIDDLTVRDASTFEEHAKELHWFFTEHERKEEQALYPKADAICDELERSDLVRRIQAT